MCKGPIEVAAAPASEVRMSQMHLTYMKLWYGGHTEGEKELQL